MGIIIVGFYGLLYSDSGMEALFDVNMILLGILVLLYSCTVDNFRNKIAELEDKNNKL